MTTRSQERRAWRWAIGCTLVALVLGFFQARYVAASTAQLLYETVVRASGRVVQRISMYGQDAAEADQPVAVDSSGRIITAPTSVTLAAQVVPQVPSAVACDTTGAVAFTANAADVRLTLWNTGAQDVCVRFGATSGADIGTLTTCTFRLAADAGAGTADVYETPAGMRVGGESFACDVASGTSSVAVTAWRAE